MFITPRRALSLPEVLVSSAIFCGLLLALVLIERMSARAMRQGEAAGDTYQLAMLAINRLKSELRGARVVQVSDQEIHFQVPQLDPQGNLVVDSQGHPFWLPTDPVVRIVGLNAGGELILSEGDESRRLARLGQKGEIHFSMPASTGHDLLNIRLHAEVVSQDSRQPVRPYDSSITLYLSNRI